MHLVVGIELLLDLGDLLLVERVDPFELTLVGCLHFLQLVSHVFVLLLQFPLYLIQLCVVLAPQSVEVARRVGFQVFELLPGPLHV